MHQRAEGQAARHRAASLQRRGALLRTSEGDRALRPERSCGARPSNRCLRGNLDSMVDVLPQLRWWHANPHSKHPGAGTKRGRTFLRVLEAVGSMSDTELRDRSLYSTFVIAYCGGRRVVRCLNCQLSVWGDWGDCQENTMQYQNRHVVKEAHDGGMPCEDGLRAVRQCTAVVDCIVSPWTRWGECSRTCGGGQTSRHRQVTQNPRMGGRECPIALIQTTGLPPLCVLRED
ncbi:unnamed protein product [Polarella glacialis]|uniref:Spondin-like TSP1 domain-containing protein n=1 Tax=Polarella glacialis TaxID=89957 RepID=A0A813JR96_POLGL|nr:unnamed protein product [Polarella glacialis]